MSPGTCHRGVMPIGPSPGARQMADIAGGSPGIFAGINTKTQALGAASPSEGGTSPTPAAARTWASRPQAPGGEGSCHLGHEPTSSPDQVPLETVSHAPRCPVPGAGRGEALLRTVHREAACVLSGHGWLSPMAGWRKWRDSHRGRPFGEHLSFSRQKVSFLTAHQSTGARPARLRG